MKNIKFEIGEFASQDNVSDKEFSPWTIVSFDDKFVNIARVRLIAQSDIILNIRRF